MNSDNENVKITVSIRNKANLLANANVSINTAYGFVTIKGFQIWKSTYFNDRLQNNVNIEPPCIPLYGRYWKIVFFEDKQIWPEIEKLIYSAYLQTRTEYENSEEVNPDDIPL